MELISRLYLNGIVTRQVTYTLHVGGVSGVTSKRGGENMLQRKSGPGRHEGRAFCSVHYPSIIIIVQ
jgi:hypothetical protein